MEAFLLNDNWDIQVDSSGNFATTNSTYEVAQRVACKCRAFTQDMVFNQEDGIAHFLVDISTRPNTSLISAEFVKTALLVEEVASASFVFDKLENRVITGTLNLTLKTGEQINVTI